MRDRRSYSPNTLTGRDVPAARAFDLGQWQRAAVA